MEFIDMIDVTTIQPFSAIIGATITATAGFLVTYFFVLKRKRLEIRIRTTEELTRALRGHNRAIAVSVDGQPFLTLNRSVIEIRNTGNSNIEKFSFNVEIPREHDGALCDAFAHNRELYNGISISRQSSGHNPTFNILVGTFLNPGEEFLILVFFDQDAVQCNVQCRIPDTTVKIKHGDPIFDYRRSSRIGKSLFIFVAAYFAVALFFLVFMVGVLSYSFVAKVAAFWHFLKNLQ